MARRILWWAMAALVVGGAALAFWLSRPRPVLTVTTWPGDYGRAQAIAFMRPFADRARVDVRIAQYDGGLDHLRDEVRSHQYDWDVIDFELDDAIEACHAGLLEAIDVKGLPAGADGVPAMRDFVRNAVGHCWVGSMVFSQVIAFAKERYGGTRPTNLGAFFDLSKFPGGRALRGSSPKLNLELALLADGVPPDRVYPTLSTEAGVARALRKLDSIRPAIRWWSNSNEPVEMLMDGRAAMATALNGDIFDAQIHNKPVDIVWDRQLYELDVFAVPRGDPRKKLALDFVTYATGSQPLAHASNWLPYGPARRSSLALIRTNPETGIAMLAHMPTAPANFATSFAVDDEWWRIHGGPLSARWRAWRNQAP